eukprot:4748594-Karenia_brevis.AAC.1
MNRATPTLEHTFMRTAYEKQFGRLLAEEIPSKAYMGVKTIDVEEDEPKAERLTEVTGISELQEDFLTTSINENGLVMIKKGSKA